MTPTDAATIVGFAAYACTILKNLKFFAELDA